MLAHGEVVNTYQRPRDAGLIRESCAGVRRISLSRQVSSHVVTKTAMNSPWVGDSNRAPAGTQCDSEAPQWPFCVSARRWEGRHDEAGRHGAEVFGEEAADSR